MKKYLMGICVALVVVFAAVAFAQVKSAAPSTSPKTAQTTRWELRLLDLGKYAKSVHRTGFGTDGGRTDIELTDEQKEKYVKDKQELLDNGWEPFSAGVYNGQPYSNMEYVWFRRPRPATSAK